MSASPERYNNPTNDELRQIARSHVGDDHDRIERMVESYQAGGRLRKTLDNYAAAGIEGGLPGMEAHIKRQSEARKARRTR
jgi:hypothetical protein